MNMLYTVMASTTTTTTTTTNGGVYPYLLVVLTICNFEGNFYCRFSSAY